MTSIIEQLTALQAAVHEAAWGIIEVETRERGWRADDAASARTRYEQSIAAYKTAFGIEPEMEDKYAPGLHGEVPLAKPTQQRIIALCGSEVA